MNIASATGNIVVFGVGHSGTSITSRMLGALGWVLERADSTYAEDTLVRKLNEEIVVGQKRAQAGGGHHLSYDPPAELIGRMRAAIDALAEPWAVKDPRFVHTIQHWRPVAGDAILLWLHRPIRDVARSFERRGQKPRRGGLRGDDALERMFELAEQQYDGWTGRKCILEYSDLCDAARLFDPERGKRGPRPGEPMPR